MIQIPRTAVTVTRSSDTGFRGTERCSCCGKRLARRGHIAMGPSRWGWSTYAKGHPVCVLREFARYSRRVEQRNQDEGHRTSVADRE